MIPAALHHAFYFAVAACSLASVAVHAMPETAPAPSDNARIAVLAVDRTDNPVDAMALVSGQVAR